MRKLLSLFASLSTFSSAALVVVSCAADPSDPFSLKDAMDLENYFKKTQFNRFDISKSEAPNGGDSNKNAKNTFFNVFEKTGLPQNSYIKGIKNNFKNKHPLDFSYDVISTDRIKDGYSNRSLVKEQNATINTEDDLLNFYQNNIIPDEIFDLKDVITVTDLGKIHDNKSETILSILSFKNGGKIVTDGLKVSNITNNSATISAGTSKKYKGSVDIKFTIDSNVQVDLKSIINDSNLGNIEDNSEKTIETLLLKKFPDLNNYKDQYEITNISISSADVKAKDDAKNLRGIVTLKFVVKPSGKVSLDKFIPNDKRELGDVNINDADDLYPSVEKSLKNNFKEMDLDFSQLNISDIKFDGCVLSAKKDSTNYEGSVKISFKIKNKNIKDLATALIEQKLGVIPDVSKEVVSKFVGKKNPDLDLDHVIFDESKHDDSYWIIHPDNIKYNGDDIKVYFYNSEQKDISKIIPKNDFYVNPKDKNGSDLSKLLKNEIEEIYPMLDPDQFDCKDIKQVDEKEKKYTANIVASDYSVKYIGSKSINFTLRKEIEDAVSNKGYLGKVKKEDVATLEAVTSLAKLKNNQLDWKYLKVTESHNADGPKYVIWVEDSRGPYLDGSVGLTYDIDTDDTPDIKDLIPVKKIHLGSDVFEKIKNSNGVPDDLRETIFDAIIEANKNDAPDLKSKISLEDFFYTYSDESKYIAITVKDNCTSNLKPGSSTSFEIEVDGNYFDTNNFLYKLGDKYTYMEFTMAICIKGLYWDDTNKAVYIPFDIV